MTNSFEDPLRPIHNQMGGIWGVETKHQFQSLCEHQYHLLSFHPRKSFDDVLQGLESRLNFHTPILKTYQIVHDSQCYPVEMPISETFESYLNFGDQGDPQVQYQLTPISYLLRAIKSITRTGYELPNEYQTYILDFLDLRPSIVHDRVEFKGCVIHLELSVIGIVLHGQSTIKVEGGYSGDTISLNFVYGQLSGLQEVKCRDHPERHIFQSYYKNGVLTPRTMTWPELINAFYLNHTIYTNLEMFKLFSNLLVDAQPEFTVGDYKIRVSRQTPDTYRVIIDASKWLWLVYEVDVSSQTIFCHIM